MDKTYVELVIEGPEEYARGYINGFVAARGGKGELIFDDEAGFADDGILQKIKEALHLTRQSTHCYIDEHTAALVREAIGGEAEHRLSIRHDRVIREASLAYELHMFNRELAQKAYAVLHKPPLGVRLIDHQIEGRVDPDAKGAELFTPVHDFEIKASGTAVGPLDKIVWMYKELASYDQVRIEPIHLSYRTE